MNNSSGISGRGGEEKDEAGRRGLKGRWGSLIGMSERSLYGGDWGKQQSGMAGVWT